MVYQASKILLKYYGQDKQIQYKSPIDIVTIADKEIEIWLCKELESAYPDFSIIAEEGYNKEGSSGYSWLLDPLDGTTSFAHTFPLFCISLALVDSNNQPILGVVYNPIYDEMFCAIQGQGAWLNEKLIHVSNTSSISLALLGTGFPYNRRSIMESLLSRLCQVLHVVHDIRRTGSAALDICFVACGRLDAYYEEGLKPWDTAAAILVAIEAGGQVTLFNGQPFDVYCPNIIASNGHIHQAVIELL